MRYQTFSNQEIYREKLLTEFPIEPPSGELFLTTDKSYGHEDDKELFLKQCSIFSRKKWTEINFDDAYELGARWGPFPALSKLGEIYYLPAFLSYLYEVNNLDNGMIIDYFDNIFFSMTEDKEVLDQFTVEQAKLIALCLVNLANLLDETDGAEKEYQKELTSNWGHFLLF